MVHTFPAGISPKVNVIAHLDFQPAYCDVTVLQITHYTTGTISSISPSLLPLSLYIYIYIYIYINFCCPMREKIKYFKIKKSTR